MLRRDRTAHGMRGITFACSFFEQLFAPPIILGLIIVGLRNSFEGSKKMLPSTVERVPRQTADEVNYHIRQQTLANIRRFRNAAPDEIEQRLHELDHEWDIERTLEANAATAMLVGLALGATVDRRWFIFPGVVAGFLMQHALQGWCPPLPIFRRLGIRTSYEIDSERYALKQFLGESRLSSQRRG
jgi:hypothetical protein